MTAAQLDRRLLTYSITAGAVLAGASVPADIISTERGHTQVNPRKSMENKE
jgi:hypothetical protein